MKTEFHYLEVTAEEIFNDKEWQALNDTNVSSLANRKKIAKAVLEGKLTITLLETDYDQNNPEDWML